MDTAKDVEILDLGFNFGLYAITLAGTAGAMQNSEDPYTKKFIELADSRADDLKRSLKRCNLAVGNVKSATELGSYQNTMAYLLSQGNVLAQEIANEIVAMAGNRQEKIFLLAVKISQAVGAKQLGHNYSLDMTEMSRIGRDIGLDQKDIARWVNAPTSSVFSELRQKLQELVIHMSRPEIIRNKYIFENISGSNINIDSTLSNVTQNISTTDNLDNTVKQELTDLVERLKDELQKVTLSKKEDAEAVAESAKIFVEASTKTSPNKKVIQTTAKGLLKAAKDIKAVMPSVLIIASQIVKTVFQFMGIPLP